MIEFLLFFCFLIFRFVILLIFEVICVNKVNLVRVKCEFRYLKWPSIGDIYACNAKNIKIISRRDRNVTEVTGIYLRQHSNLNVKEFYVLDQIVYFFPRNLNEFLPNITIISFYNTGLREIQQKDLKPFGNNLEYLLIGFGAIETLEVDLFKFNENLKFISFYFNRIKFVKGNVFEHLTQLKSLWMNGNKCVNRNSQDNRAETQEILTEMSGNCTAVENVE